MTVPCRQRVLVIVGPTAAGKSGLAVRLALELGGEVISADSMQVYRGFDIGTGKIPLAARRGVPHHLIDVVDPLDRFSAARFVAMADPLLRAIVARGHLPIVVGGTGLYVRALFHGLFPTPEADPALRRRLGEERDLLGTPALHRRLATVDPERAAALDPNDFVRISRALEIFEQVGRPASELRRAHAFRGWRHPALLLGLRLAPSVLAARIDARVDQMLGEGWLDEVRRLRAAGYGASHPMGALGYRHLTAYLEGELSYEDAVRLTKRDTRRFARRQRNWFSQEDGVLFYDEPFDAIDAELLRARLDEPVGETGAGR